MRPVSISNRSAILAGSLCLASLSACAAERAPRPLTGADTTLLEGDWVGAVATRYFNATLFFHLQFERRDGVQGGRWQATVDGPHAAATFERAEFGRKTLRLWLSASEVPALEGRLDGATLTGQCRINSVLTGGCVLVRLGHDGWAAAAEAAWQRDTFGWRGLAEIAARYTKHDDTDSVFIWLRRAVRQGMTVPGAYSIPDLAVLRHHARFLELVPDPVAAYPELSQRRHSVGFGRRISIPMRDGVALVADLAMPVPTESGGESTLRGFPDSNRQPGTTYPTVLLRTPYGRAQELDETGWLAAHGYVVVSQSVRGREESGGAFDPWVNERTDGYDTIEWISRQPWSNGRVGMFGGSYLGQVQWAAAAERHPALATIVPMVSGTDYMFDVPYSFGVPRLSLIHWIDAVRGGPTQRTFLRSPAKLETLPLSQLDDAYLGYDSNIWDRWLDRDVLAAWNGANFLSDLEAVSIPVLHLSGWWDAEAMGTARNYAALRTLGRENQWLIYGPWPHSINQSSRFADMEYGPTAILQLEPVFVRWFDTWLKGRDVRLAEEPKVRVFLTGANEWRRYGAWPPGDAEVATFFLASAAPLRGAIARGALTHDPPAAGAPGHHDEYSYDPAAVSPLGPYGGRIDLNRSTTVTVPLDAGDVLIYASSPFEAPVDFAGPATLELYFSTTARDTDLFAFVVDIDARGAMRAVTHPGKLRLRYLSGWDTPAPLQPDSVYRVAIELFPFAHRFARGHRLGIVVRSEFFPAFARNLNTGAPIGSSRKMAVARQRVYHDALHPSALRLWVLTGGSDGERR